MADKGTPGDGPSLEMPSLPFGRKKRRGATEDDASGTTGTTPDPGTASPPAPTRPAAAEPTRPAPPKPAAPAPTRAAEPTPPAARQQPAAPVTRPTPTPAPPTPTGPPAAASPTPSPVPSAPTQRIPATDPGRHGTSDMEQAPEHASGQRRTRQLPPLPNLPGLGGVRAALATGAAVGLVGVLLVWLASLGCEAVRGTASCGDGPGFLVLAVILVALAYLGGVLLRGFGVPDAGSTSLLAVGVMAVLVLVFFTDALFSWWMALVVPVVSAAAYALSWWVSTRAVQPHDDEAPTRL